jgi:hypothetical protein
MQKILFLGCLFLSFFFNINAQSGGYMGKKHHFTVEGAFHPATIFKDKIDGKIIIFSLRPGYEIVLGKSFSLSVDAGFLNYSGGTPIEDSGSILFSSQNSSSVVPKYFVNGFDLKLKFNIYNYRTSGIIAPIGSHFSFLITRPFYNTSFSETAVFKYRDLGIGFEVGKRSIIADFVTIDYGIAAVISGGGYNTFERGSNEVVDYSLFVESRQVVSDYYLMQSVSLYLKIGYLL